MENNQNLDTDLLSSILNKVADKTHMGLTFEETKKMVEDIRILAINIRFIGQAKSPHFSMFEEEALKSMTNSSIKRVNSHLEDMAKRPMLADC